MRYFLGFLAFLIIELAAAPASAQLLYSCDFSISNVDFGNVDPNAGTAVDTTASLGVTCQGLGLLVATKVRICPNINAGSGGAISGIRRMLNPANQALQFNLYQDAARSVPWGAAEQPALGTVPPIDLTIPLLGSVSTTRTIYGRVLPNQQGAASGVYTSIFSGNEVRITFTDYLLSAPSCNSITANPTSTTFTAQANVPSNCNIAARNIDFGSHGILNTAVDAAGGLNVTCTQGTSYSIGLNNGLTGTGPTTRRMTLGDQAVAYGLYKDAARSQPWGSSGGDLVQGTGNGATATLPVYGRVPAQRTPSPGTYTDTVVVTITY